MESILKLVLLAASSVVSAGAGEVRDPCNCLSSTVTLPLLYTQIPGIVVVGDFHAYVRSNGVCPDDCPSPHGCEFQYDGYWVVYYTDPNLRPKSGITLRDNGLPSQDRQLEPGTGTVPGEDHYGFAARTIVPCGHAHDGTVDIQFGGGVKIELPGGATLLCGGCGT